MIACGDGVVESGCRETFSLGIPSTVDRPPCATLTNAAPTLLKPARVWTANNNDSVHTGWVALVDREKIAATPLDLQPELDCSVRSQFVI